jgi:hypothetical protein
MKRLLVGLPFLFTAVTVLAQATTDSPAQLSDAAAASIVGGVCIFYIIAIALWLWAAIWVMKDAKRRNSPNATLVTVLTWIPFTWVIGLIVHLVTRPKTIPGNPNP